MPNLFAKVNMSNFDFIALIVLSIVFMFWSLRKYATKANKLDERLLSRCLEPKKVSWLTKLICKVTNHRRLSALNYLSAYKGGGHKVQCYFCDDTFLHGCRQIKTGRIEIAEVQKNSVKQ
jgi:hypothetical protein